MEKDNYNCIMSFLKKQENDPNKGIFTDDYRELFVNPDIHFC